MSTVTGIRKIRPRAWVFVAALALAGSAAGVQAQDQTGRRVYDEQLRSKLDQRLPEARENGFDGGGWLNFAMFNYDDAFAQQHRMLRQYQLRGWARYVYKGEHEAFFRGLLSWNDWNGGDNPKLNGGDTFDERVERAWYRFDLGKVLRNRDGQDPRFGLQVKVGRQFMTIGTALALSMPMDAVQVTGQVGDWEGMAFLGKALRKSRNIDESPDVAHRQDRCLWGMQLAWRGSSHHRPYAYYFRNSDHTAGHPRSPVQSYEYDSHYLGVGSEGSFLDPNLRYQAEVVGEWGQSYANGVTSGRERVCALAADALLEYTFRAATRPKLVFEYLYGSGDGDRGISSVSTLGGNTAGTKDQSFNGFGYRDTGLAFVPRISNIHIYSLSASFLPLEQIEFFRRMEVGTKVFFYHKADSEGPLSDPTAFNDASWVGWEWDVFCNWRITSDLAWTVRYGAFFPMASFDGGDQTCRQFLFTGMVLSF